MAKYQKTGLIDHVSEYQNQYGDVSEADFLDAMQLVAEQKTIFYELPSSVRAQFNNDPAAYLALMETDDGLDELQGMLNPIDLSENDVAEEQEKPTQQSGGEPDSEESGVT